MNKFMSLLCKVSFIAHLFTLEEKIADASMEVAGKILAEKDNYKSRGQKMIDDLETLKKAVASEMNNIARAPKHSMQSFVAISSQNEQVSILNNALKIKKNNETAGAVASQIHND